MADWMPIESAPADEYVLVFVPVDGMSVAMAMDVGKRRLWSINGGGRDADLGDPTHWKPLPPAP